MQTYDCAVLGLGAMGRTHVAAYRESPWVRKIYGYEPDPERAAQLGRDLKLDDTTSDLDALLANPEIKLISIASINTAHAEQVERALEAGKAVICEKPMGETLADARRMVDAQERTGGFLQIGFELHYSELYRRTKQWIDAGLIGQVVNSHCRYYSSEFHKKNSWRSLSSGTLIGEKLSHYLDLQRWWTGSPVTDVYAMSAPNAVAYFNHPDNHQINMHFANDAIAQLNFVMHLGETDIGDPLQDYVAKQEDDGHALQYHIFGTEGAIETDVFRRRLRRWRFSDGAEQLVSEIVETVTYEQSEDAAWMHNTHGQNVHLAEVIGKGLPPELPVQDSFETMLCGFAAEQSGRERRLVAIDDIRP
ncbi:MAG: Gfo/Idh/MocA family oxidoreductase [Lentisphaerae bacterium]|nr:Gfo/Idh/MocA family oxidoreductase [Lentisphaerota bacterium]